MLLEQRGFTEVRIPLDRVLLIPIRLGEVFKASPQKKN